MVQSDVEGDGAASTRKVRLTPTQGRHLPKLRAPRPDVVLVAGRDLVSEVELGDEGLALLARSHHLNIAEIRVKIVLQQIFLHLIVDVRYWPAVVSPGETSQELVASIL